jgi:hypothetical protein
MKKLMLMLVLMMGLGQWGCSGSFSWGNGATSQSGTRIQTVDGRVERVDLQRSSFEIRDQSGERVFVSVPYDVRRSEADRFRTLRAGDYVRVDGRFLDRDRFELQAFLNDNR